MADWSDYSNGIDNAWIDTIKKLNDATQDNVQRQQMYESLYHYTTESKVMGKRPSTKEKKQKEVFKASLIEIVKSLSDKKILALKGRFLELCDYEYDEDEINEDDGVKFTVHLISSKGKSAKTINIWDDEEICLGYGHTSSQEAIDLLMVAQSHIDKKRKLIERRIKLAVQIGEQERMVHGFNFDILDGDGSPDMEPWG